MSQPELPRLIGKLHDKTDKNQIGEIKDHISNLRLFEAVCNEETPSLNREEALALQSDLMLAFQEPTFQRQLHECCQYERGSVQYRKAVLRLVRTVQLRVIPLYGFAATEAGVEQMLLCFKALEGDLDIQVNSLAITEVLNPWANEKFPELPTRLAVEKKPTTKFRVMDLLHLMLKEFGKASFQRDIAELKKAANYNSRRVFDFSQAIVDFEDPEGYYELEGRDDLALIVQQAILPSFGFEASKEGVQEMMHHIAPFFQDPEVAEVLDAINSKLGMTSSASKRIRALWAR